MRRIWFIFAIRQVLNPVFLKTVLVAVFLWQSREDIYYAQVFRNAPELWDLSRNIEFVRSAFVHTETTTLLVLLSALTFGIWLLSDILRRKTAAWI